MLRPTLKDPLTSPIINHFSFSHPRNPPIFFLTDAVESGIFMKTNSISHRSTQCSCKTNFRILTADCHTLKF